MLIPSLYYALNIFLYKQMSFVL